MNFDKWIQKNITDPKTIKVCLTKVSIGENLARLIEEALQKEENIDPEIKKAWKIILRSEKDRRQGLNMRWFDLDRRNIGLGDIQQIVDISRPRLKVSMPFNFLEDETEKSREILLGNLISAEYYCESYPASDEILVCVLEKPDLMKELFNQLTQALQLTYKEAYELEIITSGFDQLNFHISSIYPHEQDSYHHGIYNFIRLIVDLWEKIGSTDITLARNLSLPWRESTNFLEKRMWLHAVSLPTIFSGSEAAQVLINMSDEDFWLWKMRREVIRLMEERWDDFEVKDRNLLEERIMKGPSREILKVGEKITEDEWEKYKNHQIFVRFEGLVAKCKQLSEDARQVLDNIKEQNPKWKIGINDRHHFSRWHESWVGHQGNADLLKDVADSDLVSKAFELQNLHQIDQGDLWRILCANEPKRALGGLRLCSVDDPNYFKAWRDFFIEVQYEKFPELNVEIYRLLTTIASSVVETETFYVIFWYQKIHRQILEDIGNETKSFWEILAKIEYSEEGGESAIISETDTYTHAINSGAGQLAEILITRLAGEKLNRGDVFPSDLKAYFDMVVQAKGTSGLYGRSIFYSQLNFLFAVDTNWTKEYLIKGLSWSNPEAKQNWEGCFFNSLEATDLFEAKKEYFLEAFKQRELGSRLNQYFSERLILASLSLHEGENHCDISPIEARSVLRKCDDEIRNHAAFFLRRLLENKVEGMRAEYWEKTIKPTFQEIWPLDSDLRTENISKHFSSLIISTEESFPSAFNDIAPFLIPIKKRASSLYYRLENSRDILLREYPEIVLKLLDLIFSNNNPYESSSVIKILGKISNYNPDIRNTFVFNSLIRRAGNLNICNSSDLI